jgi:hypothetical protein
MKYSNLIRALSYRERLILLEKKFAALEKEKAESVFSNISLAESVETAVQTEDCLGENSEEILVNEDLSVKKLPVFIYGLLTLSVFCYYAYKFSPSLLKKNNKEENLKKEIYKESCKVSLNEDI